MKHKTGMHFYFCMYKKICEWKYSLNEPDIAFRMFSYFCIICLSVNGTWFQRNAKCEICLLICLRCSMSIDMQQQHVPFTQIIVIANYKNPLFVFFVLRCDVLNSYEIRKKDNQLRMLRFLRDSCLEWSRWIINCKFEMI